MATLLTCFFIYTVVVYTFGTEEDKGIEYVSPSTLKGKEIFQKYNCISCHQIYGLGGYIGPDLTNVSSRYNGSNYITAMLENGSVRMPNFHLNKEEVSSILEYLNYIDKTGISPVIKFRINYDGTITEENKTK